MMGNYHVRFGGRERRVLIEARPSRPNAEQVSARICYELGLPADLHESHASYIAHWLDILKSDKTAIITAAAKADQAFNLLAAYSGYESEPAEEAHEEAPVPAYA